MSQPRVLIIDDEPTIRQSIRQALRRESLEFFEAENGEEGLQLLEAKQPSLVFLDLRMPVMNGTEVLQRMKLQASSPYAVIVVTGHGDDEDQRECFKLGVTAFLRKPFHPIELRGLVNQSLQLKAYQRQVEELLQARTQELHEAKQQLLHAAKLSLLGELSASLAHELNQPLMVMELSIDSALESLAQRNHQELGESLERLQRNVHRGMEVVKRIRGFGRDTGQDEWAPFAPNERVQRALELVAPTLKARNLSPELDLAPELPPLWGDSVQVEQILTNLILNASDVLESVPEPHLQIRTELQEDAVVFQVSDNGGGVPPEHVPHLFKAFYTTKSAEKGSGLGLAISARIADNHSGSLTLRNQPGTGATFVLSLPVTDA